MEENPQKHTPQEIVSVESIQNLDTARMALRWALERMAKLEKEKDGLADTAAASERAKSRAQEEYAAIQKTLSLRSTDSDQRELYYAKMEEYLSLQLGGKLDLAALGKRELEVARLQELLGQKEVQLQKEHTSKRASLEREVERLKTDLEAQARARTRDIEQALELKRSSLEADYLSRMANVHEKEILHKQEAAALAERQAHFQEYYSNQRAQLQNQVKNFKAEVDDQVEFRLNISEKIVAERYTALEASWTQEKMLLVRELENWRVKTQELGPKALDLEKSLALSEELARKAQSAADTQTLLLAENRRQAQAAQLQAEQREKGLLQERASLAGELARLQEEAARQTTQLSELQSRMPARLKNWEQAQAEAKALFLRCDEQETQLAELQKIWEQSRAESAAHLLRADEQQAQRLELAKRLAVAEDSLLQSQAQSRQASERLEEGQKSAASESAAAAQRERSLCDERAALKAGLIRAEEEAKTQAARLAELESLMAAQQQDAEKSRAEFSTESSHSGERLRELETRLAISDDALRQAQAQAQQAAQRLAERQKSAQAESVAAAEREQAFLAERALLRAALGPAQEEAKAQAAELAELRSRLTAVQMNAEESAVHAKAQFSHSEQQRAEVEKKLALTEDTLRQAQAQSEQAADRLAESQKASQTENASAGEREHVLLQQRAALKSDLARAQEEIKTHAAQLAELRSGLAEREKNWNQAQAGSVALQQGLQEQADRRLELEKRLALTEDALEQARAQAVQAVERFHESERAARAENIATSQREQSLLQERVALKSDVAASQEQAKAQSALLSELQTRLPALQKNWEQAQAEAKEHLSRYEQQQTQSLELQKKLALTEDALRQAQAQAQQATERLSENQENAKADGIKALQREQSLTQDRVENQKNALAEQTALLADIAELRKRFEDSVAAGREHARQAEAAGEFQRRLLETEKKLAQTEDSLRDASAKALRASERLEEIQKTSQVEIAHGSQREQALLQERTALRSDLARAHAEAADKAAQLAKQHEEQRFELEKALAVTEDSLRQAQIEAHRLSERHAAAQAERAQAGEREQALLKERAALWTDLARSQEEARSQAAQLAELQIRLSGLQKDWEQTRAGNGSIEQTLQLQTLESMALKRQLAEAENSMREAQAETASWRLRLETSVAAARQAGRDGLEAQAAANEERRKGWDAEKKLLLAELNEWKEKVAEVFDEAAAREKAWSLAEAEAKQKEIKLQVAQEQRGKLEAELAAARQREQESLAQLLALEQGLTGSEESQNALQRQMARLEQQKISWEQERTQLQEELAQHREQFAGSTPKILDLERRLALAVEVRKQADAAVDQQSAEARDATHKAAELEAVLSQTRTAAERQAVAVEQKLQGWEAEKKALIAELGQLQDKFAASRAPAEQEHNARLEAELAATRLRAEEALPRIMALEKSLASAKDAAQQAEAFARNQQDERIRLEADLTTTRDQLHRAGTAAESGHRARASAERRLAEIEERRQSWEAEKRALLVELGEVRDKYAASQAQSGAQQRARLEAELAATRERAEQSHRLLLEAEKSFVAAKTAAEQAEGQVQAGQLERAKLAGELIAARDEARKDWDSQRKALQAELDDAKAALAAGQKRAETGAMELGPKLSSLEKAAALAEERARQAQAAVDRQAALIEERQRGAQLELAALQNENKQWKAKAAAHLAELLALKEKAAVLDEGLRQMAGLSQTQAARFDERNRAWERERQELLARIESLGPKPPST